MFQYSPILGRSSIWDLKFTFSKLFKELKNGIDILGGHAVFIQSKYVGFGSITQEPLGLP